MKKFVASGLIFLGSISFGQIRIAEPLKELGDIFEAQGIVKTTFELFNPFMNDSIEIVNIETSCGCAAIVTTERIILPRQTLPLVIAYDPAKRPGLFMKTIELQTKTGQDEYNSLFLKITGNVIPETKAVENNNTLNEYRVAPIYYYPITSFDTSYFDLGFFSSFVDDITFEVDYYQFTTVGVEVIVDDPDRIPELENLFMFVRRHFQWAFRMRGFDPNLLFFQPPIFVEGEVPEWASAKVKIYSWNFNDDSLNVSVIDVDDGAMKSDMTYLLNYQRYQLPLVDEVLKELDSKKLESKLFLDNRLDLRSVVFVPKNVPLKNAGKLMKELKKVIFSGLKKSSGIKSKNISFDFDSVAQHAQNKVIIQIWDRSDEAAATKIQYAFAPDKIVAPQLPTYRQSTFFQPTVDMATRDFRRFWKNIILNHKIGKKINLVIESSTSYMPNGTSETEKHMIARQRGETAMEFLQNKFKTETGKNLIVKVISVVHGPPYTDEFSQRIDYEQFEYLNFIPIIENESVVEVITINPYQVNYDYFFNGIDTASIVFNNFARNLGAIVRQDGYVEVRIESSISQIPIERNKSNEYLCYTRNYVSQVRLKEYLKKNLIDPNRVLIIEERNLIQGPKYDGKLPILAYKRYQYLRIIPEKFLRKN